MLSTDLLNLLVNFQKGNKEVITALSDFILNAGSIQQPNNDGSSELLYALVPILGQSNARGFGMPGYDAYFDAPNDRILQFGTDLTNTNRARQLGIAQDPLFHVAPISDARQTAIGFAVNFAKLLIQTLPANTVIVLIPCAREGSRIGNAWGVGRELYAQAVAHTLEFLSQNPNSYVHSVLYHQGESDVGLMSASQYQTELDFLINSFREDIGYPDIPFVVGELKYNWINSDQSFPSALKIELNNVLRDVPNRVLSSECVLTSDLTENPFNDTIHFTAAEQRKLAVRYFYAVLNARENVGIAKKPTNVRITNRTDTSVIIRFKFLGHVEKVIIRYKRTVDTSFTLLIWDNVVNSESNEFLYGIGNLASNTNYEVAVRIENKRGLGELSDSFTFTTLSAFTSTPPLIDLSLSGNLANTGSNLSATITNKGVTFLNDPTATKGQVGNFNTNEYATLRQALPTVFTVMCWVRTNNSAGTNYLWGASTNPNHAFLMDTRGYGITILGGNFSAINGLSRVLNNGKWQHVVVSFANGVITYFVNGKVAGTGIGDFTGQTGLVTQGLGAFGDTGSNNLIGQMSRFKIFNYALPLEQINQIYDKELFTNYPIPTGNNPPGTPTALTSSSITNTSFSLDWIDNGSPPTGYIINFRSQGTANFTAINTTVKPYVFNGLLANTTYEVNVTATNASGNSSASDNLTVTTANNVVNPPGTPTNLSTLEITTTSISIDWISNGTAATTHTIEYKLTSASTYTQITNATKPSTISGLTASTSYDIRIIAINSGGSSNASTILTVSTLAPPIPNPLIRLDFGSSPLANTGTSGGNITLPSTNPPVFINDSTYGQVLSFNSSQQFASLAASPLPISFTYAARINPSISNSRLNLIGATTTFAYLLEITAANGLQLALNNTFSSGSFALSDTGIISLGWQHIGVTHDSASNTTRFYRNGVPVGISTLAQNANSQALQVLGIGAFGASAGVRNFQGLMKGINIFNTVLSDAQMLTISNQ